MGASHPASTHPSEDQPSSSVSFNSGVGSRQIIPHPQPTHEQLQPISFDQVVGSEQTFVPPNPGPLPSAKPPRNRRRSAQGPDHVKHRRTRSGCYTCRSRRVKCDENRPICERCKKGKRDCAYPEPSIVPRSSTSSSNKAGVSTTCEGTSSSTDEYDEDEDVERMESIPDEDEAAPVMGQDVEEGKSMGTQPSATLFSHQPNDPTRSSSETPSLIQDKGLSPSPSTEGSTGYTTLGGTARLRANATHKRSSAGPKEMRRDWSHLPESLRFYLNYFCENVTNHHYFLTYDSCNFLHTVYIDEALRNDALLYAVVGFSAFQRTLHISGGKIQDFLQYYNKAVSLLLQSLKRGSSCDVGILLAILQLATIEEHLGDWINLLGHQKAAHAILNQLYTPQTVMRSNLTRVVLGWYARFDVFAGLMGGFETVLSRDWFYSAQEYFHRRIMEEPDSISWKIEEAVARHRLLAMDMSILFAKKSKGEIGLDQFITENEVMSRRVAGWSESLDPALRDPRWLVTDFSGAPPVDPNDIVNPYQPGTLFHGPLWPINLCIIDWYSIDLMHKYQTALTLGCQPSNELGMTAYAVCQLFEAIEYWPHSPNGSVLACQASLGIATLFLPRDELHHMWCRQKLALIESNGYIYPKTLREKMSALFQDPSCMHWWLPNDENYPPIIRQIRKFVDERTSTARDVPAEDLRDMKAIFSTMNLDDGTRSRDPLGQSADGLRRNAMKSSSWGGDNLSNEQLPMGQGMAADGGDDMYGLGFEEGHGFWGSGQGGGAYGIPNPEDYT